MSARENRELLERRLKLWNSGDIDMIDELFSEDYVMHGPSGEQRGVEPFKEIVSNFHKGYPDLDMHYEHVVIDDDKVAYVWKIHGTHRDLQDNAKGQKLLMQGSIFARIEDGKFVEEWRNADVTGLLVQLGVMSQGQKIERMSSPEDSHPAP